MADFVDFKTVKAEVSVEDVASRYGVALRRVNGSHERASVRSRRTNRGTKPRHFRSTYRSRFGHVTQRPVPKGAGARRAVT